MPNLKISTRSCIAIGLICIALTALIISLVPSFIDYYITHNTENAGGYRYLNHNYIIEGKYNGSYFDINNYSISLDRRFKSDLLYKECNHTKGDNVRYYGVFYDKYSGNYLYSFNDNVVMFAIKREIC